MRQARATRSLTKAAASAPPQVERARITALRDEAPQVELDLLDESGADTDRSARAYLSQLAGYRPSVGDEVLVASGGTTLFVIGVLHAQKALGILLADGASVEVRDSEVMLKDAAGRVLVRYADGSAEVASPTGDLLLSAPTGRVVLRSGTDVVVESARDLLQQAGRKVELGVGAAQVCVEPKAVQVQADRLGFQAKTARFAVKQLETLATSVSTTAEKVVTHAARYEVVATRLVEKARDALREAAELSETRAGRARVMIKDLYSLTSRRTVLTSKEETSIDGKKVLLG